MGMIRLEDGQFGWDYLVVEVATGKDLLIQSDMDYPGVASTFGWGGESGDLSDDISAAQAYLDEHIGDEVEDPGYFS